MPVVTMMAKGHITIPREVRERLHLRPGVRIEFRMAADGTVILEPLMRRTTEVFGCIASSLSELRPPALAGQRMR